ncbi:MAG: carbon starvation CstA family protein [Lentisphaerota bacterium]
MLALLFIGCCVILGLAYVFYGKFLERRLGVHESHPVPAHILEDGVDYVPTTDPILFGHHFSSIAGAGPIVGPIIAGLAFGWGPALLWIILGSIFIGGTHDMTSLVASVRHQARSVGEICRDLLSPLAYYMFLVFIWFTLVYVLIVFTDLTALSYAPVVGANASPQEMQDQLHQGGAVATASLLYIVLAVVFGISVYKWRFSTLKASLVFIPLVFIALLIGYRFPLLPGMLPVFMGSTINAWKAILLVYCFIASILPVWILLQPRDYLSSFLLYSSLLFGGVGLVLSGVTGNAPIHFAMFKGFNDPQLGFIFPALFITVACGAVSGFHSIVASGTTSKQLSNEMSARKIGFGSMMVEAVLAVIALAAIMILSKEPGTQPVSIFANGLGHFMSVLGVGKNFAATFGLMAVSTFLLTTLDTCTRLCRFVFEEMFNIRGLMARVVGTLATLALPAFMLFQTLPGPGGAPISAWKAIWPAFGATNQLLAALALLVVFAWLKKEGKKTLYVVLPLMFMSATTLTALTQLVIRNLFHGGSMLVGSICLVLDLLAVALIVDTVWNLFLKKKPAVVRA